MTANDYRMTRRSIFIGAAASLICMPALVRAASLMPIRRVIVATNPINPKKPIYLGFAGALRLHWMKQALKRGWDNRHDGRTFGGISETEARNYVAYVRSQGTLPPRGATVSDLTKVGFSRCADVLIDIAATIDARRFNPGFPKVFPRFVQHAIWRYCAQSCFDICNGNQIDDRGRCTNMWCQLYPRCDRLVLHAEPKKPEKTAVFSST